MPKNNESFNFSVTSGENLQPEKKISAENESDKEMGLFYESKILPVFKTLLSGQYGFSEIQSQFNTNLDLINQRYSDGLDIKPVTGFYKISAGKFGSTAKDKQGIIAIFIPAVLETFHFFQSIQDEVQRERFFESSVVICWMHELDHLALGLVRDQNNAQVMTKTEEVEMEIDTWARTCKNTIVPLVELHDQVLQPGDRAYYDVWIYCKKNSKSKEWRDFITKTYDPLKSN